MNFLKNTLPHLGLGSTFKGLCFVGLNKAEFIPHKGEPSVYADNWQGVIDEGVKKSSALVFFAPRDLSGEAVDPYVFLGGEDLDPEDEDEQALLSQTLNNMALLDFCRMPVADANTLHIMLVADVLYHWDTQDNYVLPTTSLNWIRDTKRIIKSYPKSTAINIYTNWNLDTFTDIPKNVTFKSLHDIPLKEECWVNRPTFQEKHGALVLLASVCFMAAVAGFIVMQQKSMRALNTKIAMVEQGIPREGKYMRLSRPIKAQEAQMKYRRLFPLLVQDVAQTIALSNMKVESFEVRNPKPQDAPKKLVAMIEAKRDAYKGWLQEEPVAKKILLNSATFSALRKPPGNAFKLEGLMELPKLEKELTAALKRQLEQKPTSTNKEDGE